MGETDIVNMHAEINTSVPGLVGMELTSLIAACTVACLGVVAKTVDNAPVFWLLLKSACTAPMPSLFLTLPPPPMSRLGVGKKWGEDTTGTAD